jgi:hypothetical protein
LVKVVKKYDRKEAELKELRIQKSEISALENKNEMEKLQKINIQQNHLVTQKQVFLKQWYTSERLRKFMRDTATELNKK